MLFCLCFSFLFNQTLLAPELLDLTPVMPSLSFFLKVGLGTRQSKSAEGAALWEDISELWFLCLTTLADCATLSPSPQTLLLPEILSLISSIPAGTFTEGVQPYLQTFQTKVSRVISKLQEKKPQVI